MARGKKGPVPEALADRIEVVADGELLGEIHGKPAPPPEVVSGSELEEILREDKQAEQPKLFKEPGIVKRWITIPLAPELLNEKRIALATLYQMVIDVEDAKKASAAQFNSELAHLNEQMRVIAKVLAKPTEEAEIECEWRVLDGEHARGLYRLDTGECLEKAALTAEDRAAEVEISRPGKPE